MGASVLEAPAETDLRESAPGNTVNQRLPRLAFVHIPKTAGTSVTSSLSQYYGELTFPATTTLDYQAYDNSQLAAFRWYKGHAYRRDYERLPPDTVRFTVLRDPVRRARSYFNYFRRIDHSDISDPFVLEASHLAKTASLIENVYSESPFVIEHIRLGQVRQFLPAETLAAIGHRTFLTRDLRKQVLQDFIVATDQLDYVMTVESLSLSFALMIRELGLPDRLRILTHENISEMSDSTASSDLRRAVTDVNALEFECYEHVRLREQAWLAAKLMPLIPT